MNKAVVALVVSAAVCLAVGIGCGLCTMYFWQAGWSYAGTDESFTPEPEIFDPFPFLVNASIVGFGLSGASIVGLLVIAGVRYELDKRFPITTGPLGPPPGAPGSPGSIR